MRVFWYVITDFGDSAAMLPAAAALLLWLIANGQTRAAALWTGLFAGTAALVASSKIAFMGWGYGIPALNFTGISGHSTLSTSVIPIGCYLVSRNASRTARRAVTIAGFCAAVLIGVSRVKLGMHSWSEVVAGCSLGGASAAIFISQIRQTAHRTVFPARAMAGALVAMALLLHGNRAPSERLIRDIALELSGRDYPYTRWEMQAGWIGAAAAPDAISLPAEPVRPPGSGAPAAA